MPDQSAIQFHFLEPAWLLMLLPLALLLWLAARRQAGDTAWRRIIDARLQPLLMNGGNAHRSRLPLWLLGIGWLIAILALANPVWERQPQPLMQTNTARVIVLDLSRSMLAQDLKPTRIERARFKVEDILADDEEGLTGLVVFAGDAFTVTPLTRDSETIRAQLRALEPAIMPSQGSRADLGLLQALDLLQQAGVVQGQIILIADGVEGDLATEAAEQVAQQAADPLGTVIERWDASAPLMLLVGPEGGLTSSEVSAVSNAGFVPARLGPLVLRFETAAIAAIAIVAQQLETRRPPRAVATTAPHGAGEVDEL